MTEMYVPEALSVTGFLMLLVSGFTPAGKIDQRGKIGAALVLVASAWMLMA